MAGSGSNLPLNLGYIKTKPGMFKGISVALGLLGMAFTDAAYDKGAWYHTFEVIEETHTRKIDPERHCRIAKGEDAICPWSWLVAVSVAFISMSWVISAALLVAYLIVDLNQNGPVVIVMDFVIQVGSGAFFILGTLVNLAFLIMLLVSDYSPFKCGSDDEKGPDVHLGLLLRSGSNAEERSNVGDPPTSGSCNEQIEWAFQFILLIIGVLFTIPAGVLYLITAVILKKLGGVAPMMVMTPSGHQQAPAPRTHSRTEAHPKAPHGSHGPHGPHERHESIQSTTSKGTGHKSPHHPIHPHTPPHPHPSPHTPPHPHPPPHPAPHPPPHSSHSKH